MICAVQPKDEMQIFRLIGSVFWMFNRMKKILWSYFNKLKNMVAKLRPAANSWTCMVLHNVHFGN